MLSSGLDTTEQKLTWKVGPKLLQHRGRGMEIDKKIQCKKYRSHTPEDHPGRGGRDNI